MYFENKNNYRTGKDDNVHCIYLTEEITVTASQRDGNGGGGRTGRGNIFFGGTGQHTYFFAAGRDGNIDYVFHDGTRR